MNFSDEMIAENPTDTLPLFSQWAFNWTRPDNLVGSVRYALEVRSKYERLLSNPDPSTFVMGYSDNPHFITFARIDEEQALIIVASTSLTTRESGMAYVPLCDCTLQPVWGTDVAHRGDGTISMEAELGNGHVLILEAGPDFPALRG